MNLKNDERKIQLKISLIEGDIIKEFLIEVLPYYTIKQVKGFIDSTQNIGSENYVLMKLTDELTDDTIADHIRRTKKDSKNTIHLTARSLVKKSEIKIEKDIESKEGNKMFLKVYFFITKIPLKNFGVNDFKNKNFKF
jgi:hypothetical protein